MVRRWNKADLHEFFTCGSMVRSESKMTPSFRHWETGAMDVEATVRGGEGSERDLFFGAARKKTFFAMLSLTRYARK